MGASMLYQTGIVGWETTAASVPAMGFNGIAVAFLGGLNPLGSILSAFFIQYITAGGGYVDLTVYCAQISDLIAAIIIYLCAFVVFFKYKISFGLDRLDDRKNRKQGGAAK
jgi:simple sugar transport system permease protein